MLRGKQAGGVEQGLLGSTCPLVSGLSGGLYLMHLWPLGSRSQSNLNLLLSSPFLFKLHEEDF
jgi:hypothetical protein